MGTGFWSTLFGPRGPSAPTPAPASPPGSGPSPPKVSLHYEEGRPVWKISTEHPSRFADVPCEIKVRLFRLPEGALFAMLLNLYDIPDQPYYLHRVMDLSDPQVERYL